MKLNTDTRNHLRTHDFAIPETRSYPIPDEAHARNALARVAQFGSAREQARVRAAVHRKFPHIGRTEGRGRRKYKSLGHRLLAGSY